jgi:hypothetical protein
MLKDLIIHLNSTLAELLVSNSGPGNASNEDSRKKNESPHLTIGL